MRAFSDLGKKLKRSKRKLDEADFPKVKGVPRKCPACCVDLIAFSHGECCVCDCEMGISKRGGKWSLVRAVDIDDKGNAPNGRRHNLATNRG